MTEALRLLSEPGSVCLATAGDVDAEVLAGVADVVAGRLGLGVWRRPHLVDPTATWDPVRGQYGSIALMRLVLAAAPTGALRVLLVTEVDLFVPVLSFVFGQAQLDGLVAVMATARLRQSFYGLPDDRGLVVARARVEALHELGHTFGLTHCHERACAMSLATSVEHVDRKDDAYCSGCGALVDEAVAQALGERRALASAGGRP